MQELRLVAVSEDGIYAVLEVPGRSGRFVLPIDDRLRIVARGQFSRLAQYEIEVENPLRPKEIQDRIRAGETAEEIADAAGIPIERVRRFEGPVLAERAYRAQEARAATVRWTGDSGPGRRLHEVLGARLRDLVASPEEASWDSCKRPDGTWLVKLGFTAADQPQSAEWIYDTKRRHVTPANDLARHLSLPEGDLLQPTLPERDGTADATVTPIATPHSPALGSEAGTRGKPDPVTVRTQARPAAAEALSAIREDGQAEPDPIEGPPAHRQRPARKAAGGRSRRSSVPSWDEIMFGTSHPRE